MSAFEGKPFESFRSFDAADTQNDKNLFLILNLAFEMPWNTLKISVGSLC